MDRNTLADIVLILHFGVVVFNVGGLIVVLAGFRRGWRLAHHRALRVAHLTAVWFVAVESVLGYACPLTVLEDHLRQGGDAGGGFLQRWLSRILYWDLPLWVFALAYVAFASTVTATFITRPPSPKAT